MVTPSCPTPGPTHRTIADGPSQEVPVRVFGTRVHLTVEIYDVEQDRRERAGLGALTELATLDGLLNLPLGLAVDIVDLTDTERRVLARLPTVWWNTGP